MNITLSARDSSISQSTKDYAMEKAEKLEKFYRLRKISMVMEVEGEKYTLEIVVSPERSGKAVIGNAIATDWFSAIDQAIDKVEGQLRKIKGKVKSHRVKKQAPEANVESQVKQSEPDQKEHKKEETYKDVIEKMET